MLTACDLAMRDDELSALFAYLDEDGDSVIDLGAWPPRAGGRGGVVERVGVGVWGSSASERCVRADFGECVLVGLGECVRVGLGECERASRRKKDSQEEK
jgi:hypothetical protein